MIDKYNVNLINNERCNFDNGEFTNLKDAKEWASGRGKNYTAYFKKNYDADIDCSEEEFEIEY